MQALDDVPAGVELVDVLAALDVELLTPDEQLSYLAACERIAGWIRSLQDRALVAFVGSNPRNTIYTVDGDEHALMDARRADIVAELRWSEASAHRRITEARALATDLPAARDALRAGALLNGHVQAIVEAAHSITGEVDAALESERAGKGHRGSEREAVVEELRAARVALLERFEARVVPYAMRQSVARSRQQLRRAVASLDPLGFAARRERALREHCDVRVDQLPDGLSMISAVMASEHAVACMRVVDALARDRRFAEPGRRIGARRVDAFIALVAANAPNTTNAPNAECAVSAANAALPVSAENSGSGGGLGAKPGITAAVRDARTQARVDVVIDLASLLGFRDESAMLAGVGPIPAAAVRDLVLGGAGVAVRRIVTDPADGSVLEVGRRSYAVDAALRRFIDLRDTRCRFPGCTQPASRCECDHALPFDAGGATAPDNLGLACKRHHQCKTHGRWTIVDSEASGACTWVSPLGRRYRAEAEPPLDPASEDGASRNARSPEPFRCEAELVGVQEDQDRWGRGASIDARTGAAHRDGECDDVRNGRQDVGHEGVGHDDAIRVMHAVTGTPSSVEGRGARTRRTGHARGTAPARPARQHSVLEDVLEEFPQFIGF